MLSGFYQFPCAAIILSIRGPHSTEVYLIFYKFPYVHIFVVIAYFTFLVHNCFLLGCKLYMNINRNAQYCFGQVNQNTSQFCLRLRPFPSPISSTDTDLTHFLFFELFLTLHFLVACCDLWFLRSLRHRTKIPHSSNSFFFSFLLFFGGFRNGVM
jgi:hypothetical protein